MVLRRLCYTKTRTLLSFLPTRNLDLFPLDIFVRTIENDCRKYEACSNSFFALESLVGFTFRSFHVMKCVFVPLFSFIPFSLSLSLFLSLSSSFTRSYHKRKLIKETKSKRRSPTMKLPPSTKMMFILSCVDNFSKSAKKG